MTNKIIVYLDTKDYINIHNDLNRTGYSKTFEEIKKYKDLGVIFAFSYLILGEFITKPSNEYRLNRSERGKLVRDICGENAFPIFDLLDNTELFKKPGSWLYFKDRNHSFAKDFYYGFFSLWKKMISEKKDISRNQRRFLSKESSMRNYIKKFGNNILEKREDFKDMPVSDDFIESKVIYSILSGECSFNEFDKKLKDWILNPEYLSEIFYIYSKKDNLLGNLRDSEKKLGENLNNLHKSFEEIKESNKIISELRKKMIRLGMSPREVVEKFKKIDYLYILENSFNSLSWPVSEYRRQHILHYTKKSMNKHFKYEESDMRDLFHMFYAYDCDLFSCDKRMSGIFHEYIPFKGKILNKIDNLSEEIERINSLKKIF